MAEATQAKCSSLEKTKQRLQGEVEELCMNLEKVLLSYTLGPRKDPTWVTFQFGEVGSRLDKRQNPCCRDEQACRPLRPLVGCWCGAAQ